MLPRPPLSFFVPLKLNDCASLFILCTLAKPAKPRANSATHAYLKLTPSLPLKASAEDSDFSNTLLQTLQSPKRTKLDAKGRVPQLPTILGS